MLNLIRFLTRYSFFIQFLLLEIFCFYLVIQNNNYQKASFLNYSGDLTGSIYQSYDQLTNYFSLDDVNRSLAEENAKNKNYSIEALAKTFGKNIIVNDTTYHQKYLFTSAKIINNSINKRNNYLTLDKGKLHGIEVGMGVITHNGVVGIVKSTSENFSTVLSILHKDINISAQIKKNQYFGSMIWDGSNHRIGKLNDIPSHVKLNKGDTITTSGFSAIFPENVTIGIINTFTPPDGSNFYDIEVSYSVDYQNLSYVYIVKNLFKTEITDLEKENEGND